MAWRTFLALGLVSTMAVACTAEVKVNGGTNDGGPDGATSGGASGSGGGGNTGGSKGGSGGSTGGGTATGGGKATGGGTSTGGASGDAGFCTPTSTTDDCSKCAMQNCCQDYSDCQNDACAGTAAKNGTDGELFCMISCLYNGNHGLTPDGGVSGDLSTCADQCKKGPAVLDQQTQAVITCLTGGPDGGPQTCGVACF